MFKFVLFGFIALLLSSCAKEEENGNPHDTITPDEYYIRYELETTFIGRDREMIVTNIDDKDAPLVYNMRTGMGLDIGY